MTIPKDDAWKVFEQLGNCEVAHFIDLNKSEQPFNLPYASRIKLCDETERKIHYLIQRCREMRIRIKKPSSVEVFSENIASIENSKKKAMHLLFDAIEQDVADKEEFVQRMSKQIQEMQNDVNKMDDYKQVLKFVKSMVPQLGGARPMNPKVGDEELKGSIQMSGDSSPLLEGGISFIAGTIQAIEQDRMKKMLFRATRG